MKIPRTNIESAVAHKSEPCKYLRHVYIDRTNNRLIASDGRIMAVVPVDPESFSELDTSGYVTTEAIDAARKIKHYADLPDALVAGESLAVLAGPTFPRPTEDSAGRYPDTDRIMHSQHSQAYICLDAARLLDLAKAINATGEKCLGVRVYLPYDGTTALRVEPYDNEPGQGAFGYIMPLWGVEREVYPKS